MTQKIPIFPLRLSLFFSLMENVNKKSPYRIYVRAKIELGLKDIADYIAKDSIH